MGLWSYLFIYLFYCVIKICYIFEVWIVLVIDFIRGVLVKAAYIALGYRCNHQCIMCPLSNTDQINKAFTFNQVLESFQQENLNAGDHVTLSGGEPTLVEFLPELIRFLNQKKIHVTLLTNASGFANRDYAEKIKACSDSSRFNVVIALHSSNPKVHDYITGVQGSFYQSMLGVHNLIDVGINVTIKHIITGLTYKGLPSLAEMICKEFPPKVEVQFTSTDYSGKARNNTDRLVVRFNECREYLEKALHILSQECLIPYHISMIEMPLCACNPKYWRYYRIIGDRLDYYLAPNVNNPHQIIYEIKNKCAPVYPECEECHVKCFCPGVWDSAYKLIGSGLLRTLKLNNEQL